MMRVRIGGNRRTNPVRKNAVNRNATYVKNGTVRAYELCRCGGSSEQPVVERKPQNVNRRSDEMLSHPGMG